MAITKHKLFWNTGGLTSGEPHISTQESGKLAPRELYFSSVYPDVHCLTPYHTYENLLGIYKSTNLVISFHGSWCRFYSLAEECTLKISILITETLPCQLSLLQKKNILLANYLLQENFVIHYNIFSILNGIGFPPFCFFSAITTNECERFTLEHQLT